MSLRFWFVVVVSIFTFATEIVSVHATPTIGDGEVFAQLPTVPGYPEGIAKSGKFVFVTTPARFGTAGAGPSQIYIYKKGDGSLITVLPVAGELLSAEHGLSGAAVDSQGRLYAISTQLGILRFTKTSSNWASHTQETWATAIPDLNPTDGIPPLPNDVVFDSNGNLYISDSLQATIWKVPATGGAPQIWFQSPELIITGQTQLGPNGLRLSPDRDYFYLAYSGGAAVDPGELAQNGRIYRLPNVEQPTQSDLETVFLYTEAQIPDGIAFDRGGRLFVLLAGTNAISIVDFGDPDDELPVFGTEVNQLVGPSGSAIPYTQPANLIFRNRERSIFVTNHAIFTVPPPNLFAVLKVYVGVKGDRLEKPNVP